HPLHRIFIQRRFVKDEGGRQVRPVRGKAEALASAPAEARYKKLAVCRGKLQSVSRNRIQIGGDPPRIQMADRLCDPSLWEIRCAAAVRPHVRKKVGSDR